MQSTMSPDGKCSTDLITGLDNPASVAIDPDAGKVYWANEGSDLLSHITAVPSARMGLTSLFGKVRGEPHCYNHLKF